MVKVIDKVFVNGFGIKFGLYGLLIVIRICLSMLCISVFIIKLSGVVIFIRELFFKLLFLVRKREVFVFFFNE